MIALFYDKKNKRQVTSDQLMKINYVENYATIDTDGEYVNTGRKILPNSFEAITLDQYNRIKKDKYYEESFQCELPKWDDLENEKTPIVVYAHERVVSNIGYKSEKCPKHANWDLHCLESDLIFLNFI